MPFNSDGKYVSARSLVDECTLSGEKGQWRCWHTTCRKPILDCKDVWCHCGHVYCEEHADDETHLCTNLENAGTTSILKPLAPTMSPEGDVKARLSYDKAGLYDEDEFDFLGEVFNAPSN